MTKWIEDWFGSRYYSLLYKHRDDNEARGFLDNLQAFLALSPGMRIADCGCGKGRHSIYLAQKGFEVTGLDISEANINDCKKNEGDHLTFFTHDLRNLSRTNYYDAAMCLFTSFGYFESDTENNKVIRSISASLKKNGWLILDFLNAEREEKNLCPEEKIGIASTEFRILRSCKKGKFTKEIHVSDNHTRIAYRENVKAYRKNDLENFFIQNGLEVVHLLGDYDLKPFSETSDRLILIGKKK